MSPEPNPVARNGLIDGMPGHEIGSDSEHCADQGEQSDPDDEHDEPP